MERILSKTWYDRLFLRLHPSNAFSVQKVFEILNADEKVRKPFWSIFAGIMRCDVIAAGIINAAKEIGIRKPIAILLQGTKVKEAKIIIKECAFRMILAEDLEDVAT